MAKITCEECRFWNNSGRSEYGTCRKYAPKPYIARIDDAGDNEGIWPRTFYEDWCGEAEAAGDD